MQRYTPAKENYIDTLLDKEINEELVSAMLPKGTSDESNTVRKYLAANYPTETLRWVKDAKWTLKDVPLSIVKMSRRPGGAREQDKVARICECIKNGEEMEPVVLVKTPDSSMLKIADGYHRTLGFDRAGVKTIKAWVGEVNDTQGPWDKEMHEKKLNVGQPKDNNLSKEAAIGTLAGKAGKFLKNTAVHTAKSTYDAGKTLSGYNTVKSNINKNLTLNNPNSTVEEINKANKRALKSNAGLAGSWGLVGTGVAGKSIAERYKKERENKLTQQYKQNKTKQPYRQ